jgi:hypothetical protein
MQRRCLDFCICTGEQAEAASGAASASAELIAERDRLADELQQSQQALDSMQVRRSCCGAVLALLSRHDGMCQWTCHRSGTDPAEESSFTLCQEQLWAYEDADTQREAVEARLAASEAECQQLRADLDAARCTPQVQCHTGHESLLQCPGSAAGPASRCCAYDHNRLTCCNAPAIRI